ncbi:MAG: aldehyde dehydrogenase family protein [Candidatus Caldarchaeum sp.]|jgi:glyceraldehyde-3-phosphate dehydrogenase [NAD(P)+]|uniref:Aldehyde dehydrogenase n=1 Tax=Caldiarchaeum subterraneum TaxID=311458 RepID=A0A7C4E1H5_CALS0|nr:aldehyde dehydrogenase family protein [Candidatus Caldarchaeales archaeon]MDJ0272698.1 aldehyde dehydrogenase family protein [Candidatus Caldarchaeales archaeon]
MGISLSRIFSDLFTQDEDGVPVFGSFVGGSWHVSKDKPSFNVVTPIDGTVVARVQRCGAAEVAEAVKAAKENQHKIRSLAAIDRVEIMEEAAQILKNHAEEIASVITHEMGRPLADSPGEVNAVVERLELSMEDARKISGEYIPGDWSPDTVGKIAVVLREPIGVVGAIGPFNYPLFIPAAKIIPAVLGANSVVAKPASATPISLLLFARVLQLAGLPDGVLNVVTGSGEVGAALASHPDVGMISFTGSTEVGKEIARNAVNKRLHLELGGKGYAIVLDDADIDLAARKCVDGALRNAGQRCDAVSIVLVQEQVADEFVEKVLQNVEAWRMGDPRDMSTRLGPLVSSSAAKRVNTLVKQSIEKGATLAYGGEVDNAYHQPTVLTNVPEQAPIVWEETFGPVVPIMTVKSEAEALSIASRSRYGLDAAVFTNNFYRMWKVAKALTVGEVTINDFPRHGVGFFPFGGVKDSGIGREGIGYSIEEMMVLKTIVFNLEPAGLGKLRRPRQTT